MNVEFDSKTRSFSVAFPGFSRLRFIAKAEVNGKQMDSLPWRSTGRSKQRSIYKAKNRWGTWQLRLQNRRLGESAALEISLSCHLQKRAERVTLTSSHFQTFSADHILVHGRQMGGCESFLLKKGKTYAPKSEYLIAISSQGNTLQLAHPLKQKDISSFSCQVKDDQVTGLSAFTVFEPCERQKLQADPVILSAAPSGHTLMEAWADLQIEGRRWAEAPQESGWNSWDYYRWTITEEEVLKNAELIASDPVLSKHIKRIVVDDGWQYCYGEWEANSLFPSGMAVLAKKLKRMGFTPGLWFAPTIAEPHSRVAQLHPEMLTPGPAGVPCVAYSCMERKGFVLDPTHPKVPEWWQEIFRRYADYGYRYYKLDFLSNTVPARRFANSKVRPGELMQHIIAPIRDAVGPKSRILGCNFNFDGGAGLVDDVRIASDIHASWDYVKRNVVAVGARFWAHRRFWINDPDFAVCRGKETSDDPNLDQLKMLLPYVQPEMANRELAPGLDAMDSLADLTARQAQTWLSLVIISGGVVNLSDNLPRLNEVGLRLVRKTVAAGKGEAGVPVDLFKSELPAYWVQRVNSSLHRILLTNWQDRRSILRMDLNAFNIPTLEVQDFWSEEAISVRNGRIEVELPAHACLLAECR